MPTIKIIKINRNRYRNRLKKKLKILKIKIRAKSKNSQREKIGRFRKPKRFWLTPVLTKSFSKHGFRAPTEIKPASMLFFPTFFLGSTERLLTC